MGDFVQVAGNVGFCAAKQKKAPPPGRPGAGREGTGQDRMPVDWRKSTSIITGAT